MKISLIAAIADNRVIGVNGQMPWHLSADLQRFKSITMGSPIIMGRKTFESIGKPLPGRSNIIISRNRDYRQSGCLTFSNLTEALEACHSSAEAFVIGGAALYQSALPQADYLYLTKINKIFAGDTFFPEIDFRQWKEIEREDVETNASVGFSYSFLKYEHILADNCSA